MHPALCPHIMYPIADCSSLYALMWTSNIWSWMICVVRRAFNTHQWVLDHNWVLAFFWVSKYVYKWFLSYLWLRMPKCCAGIYLSIFAMVWDRFWLTCKWGVMSVAKGSIGYTHWTIQWIDWISLIVLAMQMILWWWAILVVITTSEGVWHMT